MKWNVKRDLPYFIPFVVFVYLVPLLPVFWPTLPDYLLFWPLIPLAAGVIALIHSVNRERFSPVLPVAAVLAVAWHSWHLPALDVLRLSITVLIVLILECFPLLNRFQGETTTKWSALLHGAATNRRYLTFFCFWVLIIPCVMQVILSHEAAGDLDHLIMPIALALTPEWLVILWLLHLEYSPLTKGALLGTVLIYLLSIPAVTLGLGYQNQGGPVALGFITLGYVVLLLLEGLTAALRYRKRNRQADACESG